MRYYAHPPAPGGTFGAATRSMICLFLQQLLSLLLDRSTVAHRSDRDNDMEILLLRQQLRMLQRMQP